MYGIDTFNTAKEFLLLLAKKLNRVKSGGIFNLGEAARILIKDWN